MENNKNAKAKGDAVPLPTNTNTPQGKEALDAQRNPAAPVEIETLSVSDATLLGYMTAAAQTINAGKTAQGLVGDELTQSQGAMRLAVYRYICDTLKASPGARKQGWKQFAGTATWFGANASQAAQALKLRAPAGAKADLGEMDI